MSNRIYVEQIRHYLEGRLTEAEVDDKLRPLKLSAEQREQWERIKALDFRLGDAIQGQVEIPWLAARVTAQVNAREQAKTWLKERKLGSWPGGELPFTAHALQLIYRSVGAVLGGVIIGYFTIRAFPGFIAFAEGYCAGFPVAAAAALLLGMISLISVMWVSHRPGYS